MQVRKKNVGCKGEIQVFFIISCSFFDRIWKYVKADTYNIYNISSREDDKLNDILWDRNVNERRNSHVIYRNLMSFRILQVRK